MAFNELRLEASNLINSGGGVVFLVAGLAILALGRGSRRGRLIGGFASLWGLTNAFQNVVGYGEPERAVHLVLELAAFVALVLLIAHVTRPLTGAPRRKFIAILAPTAVGIAFYAFGTVQRLVDDRPFDQWSNFATSGLVPATLVVLLAACALRPTATRSEGRAWLLMGLSTGIYAAFFTAMSAARPTSLATYGVTALNISGLILGGVFGIVLYWVLTGRQPSDPPAARAAFLALLATGLVACIMVLTWHTGLNDYGYGSYGIARIIGALLLLIAVAKYDLLGIPLQRIVVRRSVVAGTALAALFIVAQIAQNFLSAEYGLLMGGVIAGAVLFAAAPIQRAIERTHEPSAQSGAAASARAEESYRKALRLALRDRKLTSDEEIHLHEVAEHMGIGAGRAMALRIEVETGLKQKGRRAA